jgi:hypothetical protein
MYHVASVVTNSTITKWDGTDTSLAAIQESEPNYLTIYYLRTDSEIYELYDNPEGPFSTKSDQSSYLDTCNTQDPGAPVGIGWSDQVRLYYVSGGKMVQTSLSNAT